MITFTHRVKTSLRLSAFILATGVGLSAQTIFVDFGGNATGPAGWNAVVNSVGTEVPLVDSNNLATGYSLTITSAFGGNSNSGTGIVVGNFTADATQDTLFGNTVEFAGVTAPNPTIELTGLDLTSTYDFTIYAARSGSGQDRSGTYTFTGANVVSGDYDAYGNVTNVLELTNVSPDAFGKIIFDIQKGSTNNNATGFFYLGALQIVENTAAVPEPGMVSILIGLSAFIGLYFIRKNQK